MSKTALFAALFSLLTIAAAPPAEAQEQSGLGVGIETLLSSELAGFGGADFPGVATLTYDTGRVYASGLLTFVNVDDSVTFLAFGGRVYVPIHDGDRSDFALGGGFALANTDFDGAPESDTSFHLEAGARIRAWLTSNVALGAGVGIGILIADNDGGGPDDNAVGLLGNLFGSFGITYFFW